MGGRGGSGAGGGCKLMAVLLFFACSFAPFIKERVGSRGEEEGEE